MGGRGCPHIRGGVPEVENSNTGWMKLSPHTWGCSYRGCQRGKPARVVPTYVGVFRISARAAGRLQSCPHIRGGVPFRFCSGCNVIKLSPHTWGCSCPDLVLPVHIHVVPTYVGVFLGPSTLIGLSRRCPHIRGGVPAAHGHKGEICLLSPHTWGCSYWGEVQVDTYFVVPTYVGVFLLVDQRHRADVRCPHIRGGVP